MAHFRPGEDDTAYPKRRPNFRRDEDGSGGSHIPTANGSKPPTYQPTYIYGRALFRRAMPLFPDGCVKITETPASKAKKIKKLGACECRCLASRDIVSADHGRPQVEGSRDLIF